MQLFYYFFYLLLQVNFLINLTSGIILATLFIPVILTIFGWLGWKILRSRMNTCKVCGTTYSSEFIQCPLCGSTKITGESLNKPNQPNIPASSATIDVSAEEAD